MKSIYKHGRSYIYWNQSVLIQYGWLVARNMIILNHRKTGLAWLCCDNIWHPPEIKWHMLSSHRNCGLQTVGNVQLNYTMNASNTCRTGKITMTKSNPIDLGCILAPHTHYLLCGFMTDDRWFRCNVPRTGLWLSSPSSWSLFVNSTKTPQRYSWWWSRSICTGGFG